MRLAPSRPLCARARGTPDYVSYQIFVAPPRVASAQESHQAYVSRVQPEGVPVERAQAVLYGNAVFRSEYFGALCGAQQRSARLMSQDLDLIPIGC
jgi:hypothetical protein